MIQDHEGEINAQARLRIDHVAPFDMVGELDGDDASDIDIVRVRMRHGLSLIHIFPTRYWVLEIDDAEE